MRGQLRAYQRRPVQLLTETLSTPDRLGQSGKMWTAGPEVLANVQPLGAEEQADMGLRDVRERWRVQLPAQHRPAVNSRLRFEGREYGVFKTEAWQSYFLCFVESL